jgi:GAF domain-containing protein
MMIYDCGVTKADEERQVIDTAGLVDVLETNGDDVAAALHELSHLLVSEESVQTTLQRVVDLAAQTIEGCDAAGVTLDDHSSYLTAAYTDERTLAVDRGQYALDEGPCLQAMRDMAILRVTVDEAQDRWPEFSAAARESDICSFLAAPLVVQGRSIGALNLYSRSMDGFGVVDDVLVALYGAQAAIALANATTYDGARKLSEQLQEAINSRAVIEQAKGILMHEHRISADEAFKLLRKRSTNTNVKLRVLAQQIVDEVSSGG